MMEYWLADRFGRAWLRVHGSLRPLIGDLPEECARVARGETMPAGRLWLAQDFAARVWWRFGMAMCLLLLPGGFALGILRHVHAVATVLLSALYALVCVTGMALAEAAMIRYRSDQNRLLWVLPGRSEEEPLPPGSLGLPRKADFWMIMLLAGALFLILLYAGTRTAHH